MSLPNRASIVIIGAGPSGLASAISLINQGCRDIVIVDALSQGQNTSRALLIQAATLEALDTIQCAEPLIELGFKVGTLRLRDRVSPLLSIDLASLSRYTRYPFSLVLPQNVTERVLTKKLEDLGVKVFRPRTLTGMIQNARNKDTVDMSFDDGQVIQANYVIGADGARSTVRKLSEIDFADPDGPAEINNLSQMILADVTFSSPVPTKGGMGVVSPDGYLFLVPLMPSMTNYQGFDNIYRLGSGVPVSSGPPPHAPPTAYVQDLLDKFGPIELSSDPSVNPQPVHISHTLWSSQFRTHAAAADRFFTRFGDNGFAKAKRSSRGAVIMLVGDAAHIYSPSGGQGMNLGLRDAVFLGPAIATHIKLCQSQTTSTTQMLDPDMVLLEFSATRRARALDVIRMTKGFVKSVGVPAVAKWFWWSPVSLVTIRNMIFKVLGRFQYVRSLLAWRLSGLGAQ